MIPPFFGSVALSARPRLAFVAVACEGDRYWVVGEVFGNGDEHALARAIETAHPGVGLLVIDANEPDVLDTPAAARFRLNGFSVEPPDMDWRGLARNPDTEALSKLLARFLGRQRVVIDKAVTPVLAGDPGSSPEDWQSLLRALGYALWWAERKKTEWTYTVVTGGIKTGG